MASESGKAIVYQCSCCTKYKMGADGWVIPNFQQEVLIQRLYESKRADFRTILCPPCSDQLQQLVSAEAARSAELLDERRLVEQPAIAVNA